MIFFGAIAALPSAAPANVVPSKGVNAALPVPAFPAPAPVSPFAALFQEFSAPQAPPPKEAKEAKAAPALVTNTATHTTAPVPVSNPYTIPVPAAEAATDDGKTPVTTAPGVEQEIEAVPVTTETVPVRTEAAPQATLPDAPAPAPVRRSPGPATKTEKAAKASGPATQAIAPHIAIPLPAPPPLPALPPKPPEKSGSVTSGGPESQAKSPNAPTEKPPERLTSDDTALQVVIRKQNEASAQPSVPQPAQSPALRALPETPAVPSAQPPAANSAANSTTPNPATPVPPPPAAPARIAEDLRTAPAAPTEPMEKEPAPAPTVKSVALEFTPDGAGDVKLRVSERAGEVHISLHSSDASLGGRLHEGVHDLVGSLSQAGYDAEAWTRGQGEGSAGGRPQQQEQRRQQPPSQDPGEEDFKGIYEDPSIQEIS